jgi:drug/metabolite transporter (DMT)-like permease
MIPFLARLILKEKPTTSDIVAIVLGFIGVFIIVFPDYFSRDSNENISNSDEPSQWEDLIGCGLALVSAFFSALVVIYLK